MTTPHESGFKIGRFEFKSRLIIGTGKYESFEQNLECAEASGAEMMVSTRLAWHFRLPD